MPAKQHGTWLTMSVSAKMKTKTTFYSEPRKVESSKVEEAETMGKEKVEERKDDVSTNHRTTRRTVDRWMLGTMGRSRRCELA